MPPKRWAAKGAANKVVPDQERKKYNDYYYFYRRGEPERRRNKVKLASQPVNLRLHHGVVPDEIFPWRTNEGLQRYDEYYAYLAEQKDQMQIDQKDSWDSKDNESEESESEDSDDEEEKEKAETEKWETARGLTKDMYEKGAGLHFCKILGAGGMGIICVFVSYNETQTPTFWTVKRDIGGYDEVAREKETTLTLLRAPHIVQVFHPDKEKPQDTDDDEPLARRPKKRARTERSQAEVRKESRATRAGQRVASIARKAGTAARQPPIGPTDQVEQVPKSMVMEYVARGSLYDWLEGLGKLKAGTEPDLRIPNRVLWDMMACFMKMCLAMEYPPLIFFPNLTGPDPLAEDFVWNTDDRDDGNMVPELNPGPHNGYVDKPAGTSLIHFDIDPQNVLIGDFDSESREGKHRVSPTHPLFERMTDTHDGTPMFKLIDFGLARDMSVDDACRRNLKDLWAHRRCGKPGFYLPEQFTREWEAIVESPDAQQARVAGQYSWKSNLWQLALIMHIVITFRWNPTNTIHPLRDADLIYGPPNDLPLKRQRKRSYPTYGAHLLDPQYDHVPIRLRHLVARCLCEIPDDRPSFEEIRAEIQWACDHESAEEKEAARQWSRTHFEKPPPPVIPPWKKVESWAKQKTILRFDQYLEKYPPK
ncbi:uncharacterized protein B0T23DRAFT_135594 [Neurospora hispaniola]|uniref:Protein kinase domain-containing protein n=1 Tax=Neurospora hispaniola TaxID=588809 RepID=A0AAJ0I728_9PEZI|nr:hypothetical protein B0T23DRAFT_135594 [Neurospora hispaniola]